MTPTTQLEAPAAIAATPEDVAPAPTPDAEQSTPQALPGAPSEAMELSPGVDLLGVYDASAFDVLGIYAASYDDAQSVRIRVSNRVGSGQVPPETVTAVLSAQDDVEKLLAKAMRGAFRKASPELFAWATDTPGIGVHLVARLLGVIGHPAIARPHHWEGEGADRVLVPDPPYLRTVSQLWSYTGHGDPTRRRRRGMTAEDAMGLGHPRAKVFAHLMAESAMKVAGGERRRRSPYRDVYDGGRALYLTREDWTDGHRHMAALRLTAKAILRDLWVVARASLPAEVLGIPEPTPSATLSLEAD